MLGWVPKIDNIFLSFGQDWILARTRRGGALNPGTEAFIEWANGTRWDGVVLGDTVVWKVESEQADLIPHGMNFKMRIRYPDTGGSDEFADFDWYEGKAQRRNT
ncbi:LtfC-like domain-containing protein [Rhodococcus koreensis]|uniref:LtfC-like domain-containing protein n=1 Tax=Rhodococcus koreensis TaxID=99653 RepID=UPI0036D85473